ncbi:MAG: hypothetical protein RR190_03325, partial [Bacteroidales bacterium]
MMFLILTTLPQAMFAQSGILSPYSRFGVGTVQPNLNIRNMSMGGVSVGLSGVGNASSFNPASYAFGVDTLSVIFDIGFNVTGNDLKQKRGNGEILRNASVSGGLSNFEFYFPIFRWWKMGLYLLPETQMSYYTSTFQSSPDTSIGSTQLFYSGKGGLSRLGWGNAFAYKNIAIGVNLNYRFGSFDRSNALYFFKNGNLRTDYVQSEVSTYTYMKGLSIDLGLMYVQPLNRSDKLTIGGAYTFASKLHAVSQIEARGKVDDNVSDTAYISDKIKGPIMMPSTIRVGVSYEKIRKWSVGVDFTYYDWSKFSSFGERVKFFDNTWNIAVGGEMKSDLSNSLYARKLTYRIGFRYGNLYPDYEQKQLEEFGVSLGVGFPIRKSRSTINVGIEAGSSGQLSKGQIQTNFVKIGVSFTS